MGNNMECASLGGLMLQNIRKYSLRIARRNCKEIFNLHNIINITREAVVYNSRFNLINKYFILSLRCANYRNTKAIW